jgi:hypothetical protein
MRRILVDFPDSLVDALAVFEEAQRRPVVVVISEAVEAYIAKHMEDGSADAFGLWKDKNVSGLQHQRELRSEW